MFRFLLPALIGLFTSLAAVGQTTTFAIPPNNPNATSSRDRGPNGSAAFHRTAFLYTAADMAQGSIPAGTTVNRLGFHLDAPAATAATGAFKVWVSQGVPDMAFSRSTLWTDLLTTPTPMVLVYDGSLTIPAAAGWFDIAFNQPGAGLTVQPGAGYYFAYEWVATTPSATSATYTCFNRANTLNTAVGTTIAPPLLTSNSGFRPWIRVGAAGGVNYPDAGVVQVYTLGQVPLLAGVAPADQPALPVPVEARVFNGGTQVLRNLPVALAVSGASPYTATVVLDSLRPGDTTIVRFGDYRPTAAGGHAVRVSVPAVNDSIRTNNSAADSLYVTTGNRLTYAKGFPPGNSPHFAFPVGFASDGGAMLVRHRLARPARVTHVGFAIANFPANVGRTVFAVLLDSAGQLLTPLVPHVILPTELGEYVRVALPTPVRVRGTFYAGLGQPAGAPGQADYYPLGGQDEDPVTRDSAYFIFFGDLLLLGQSPPQNFPDLGRLVVGVDLVPAPVGLAEAEARPELLAWPNPVHDRLRIQGAAPNQPVRLLDALGREVRRTVAASTGEATLDVAPLPPGVYVVQAGAATRRVVVE
mgnify:CR=1 FL=1